MKPNGRLTQAVARFMQGRYGMDQLTQFLSAACLGLMLIAMLLRNAGSGTASACLTYFSLALLLWSYLRLFSRNLSRRRAENELYLRLTQSLRSRLRLQCSRFHQRQDYVFYRCPGCREMVRVPRGKGRVRITCRRCGYSFEKKT